MFHAIDHEDIDRSFGRLQFESELFLHRGKDRRTIGARWRRGIGWSGTRRREWHFGGRPLEGAVERSAQPGAIDDDSPDLSRERLQDCRRERYATEHDPTWTRSPTAQR